MKLSISRRNFIGGCAGIGAALLYKGSLAISKSETPVPSLGKLMQSLAAQGSLHGVSMTQEEIDNLNYAYRVVKPATHTEAAFVVWAGSQLQSVTSLVDEYCRRRNSEPSQMFDHSTMKLKGWCRPDTHRILVYKEQFEALSQELTGRDVAYNIYQGEFDSTRYSFDRFCIDLKQEYKDSLNQDEIDGLYRHIKQMYRLTRPYSFCSTVAERALAV